MKFNTFVRLKKMLIFMKMRLGYISAIVPLLFEESVYISSKFAQK